MKQVLFGYCMQLIHFTDSALQGKSILSECFSIWPPLFQTNWISRRINEFSDNLNSLSIFTLNTKQFLWKYHILPTLIWTALVLLRSKKRPWKVYSPEQNSAFCNSFSSSKPTCVQLPFEILRLPKTKKGAAKIESFFKRPDTGTGRILGNIL